MSDPVSLRRSRMLVSLLCLSCVYQAHGFSSPRRSRTSNQNMGRCHRVLELRTVFKSVNGDTVTIVLGASN